MDEAAGDVLVLTEADGSFKPEDVIKLLVYLGDAGMVIGTRTTRQMVEQGANMRAALRWGNVVGGQGLRAPVVRQLRASADRRRLHVPRAARRRPGGASARTCAEAGPNFSPEMMAEAMIQRIRVDRSARSTT